VRTSEIPGVREFLDAGANLGHLWVEGHLGMGDPLVNSGAPRKRGRGQ
ncbi:MAG: ATPase, partial [Deltaproteobacteria bacterium]|nr:ATPase [Deltaproteobacteria bacterium]